MCTYYIPEHGLKRNTAVHEYVKDVNFLIAEMQSLNAFFSVLVAFSFIKTEQP